MCNICEIYHMHVYKIFDIIVKIDIQVSCVGCVELELWK